MYVHQLKYYDWKGLYIQIAIIDIQICYLCTTNKQETGEEGNNKTQTTLLERPGTRFP